MIKNTLEIMSDRMGITELTTYLTFGKRFARASYSAAIVVFLGVETQAKNYFLCDNSCLNKSEESRIGLIVLFIILDAISICLKIIKNLLKGVKCEPIIIYVDKKYIY